MLYILRQCPLANIQHFFCFVSKQGQQILFHVPSVQKYGGNARASELGRMFLCLGNTENSNNDIDDYLLQFV
jgi:hypothetical protein